jgi:hypothetical protein
MGGSTLSLPPPVFEPGLPIQVRYVHLPPDGVALIIATDDDPENALVPPAQPVSPPLRSMTSTQGSATGGGPTFSYLWFEVGGNPLFASITAGPGADQAPLTTLVESIREAE